MTGVVLLAWLALYRLGWVTAGVISVSLGAAILAAVSWADDLRGLSPGIRLLVQLIAVTIGILALPEAHNRLEVWLGTMLYFVGLGALWIWWINLFNFMDGIDGLATSEAAAVGGGLLLFATFGVGEDPASALYNAGLFGAAIGFLWWNWSPARIFLGDVGSIPLGYVSGFLLLGLAARGHWKIALIVPLYFLADATITLLQRLLRGERVWRAHRQHFYQRAVRDGLDHGAVVKRVIAADLLLIGCGWAAENGGGAIALGVAVAIVAVLLLALARSR